jgi:hypothetical protein
LTNWITLQNPTSHTVVQAKSVNALMPVKPLERLWPESFTPTEDIGA